MDGWMDGWMDGTKVLTSSFYKSSIFLLSIACLFFCQRVNRIFFGAVI